jgi:hypothetical protein
VPLVAVLYRVPLFAEALEGAFDGVAEVRAYRTEGGATGLLKTLEPDAVIAEGEYTNAKAWARGRGIPVFEVDLRAGTFALVGEAPRPADPAELRNAVAGALLGVRR